MQRVLFVFVLCCLFLFFVGCSNDCSCPQHSKMGKECDCSTKQDGETKTKEEITLSGTWYLSDYEKNEVVVVFDFEEDGTGSYRNPSIPIYWEFRWEIQNNLLCLIIGGDIGHIKCFPIMFVDDYLLLDNQSFIKQDKLP